ncbi:phosphopantetheine-binding protein [Streptomyces varsoviensis]|uniref:phosphopantetheine-binding protein n=1 Tax=Streptomyces varsoviensis TaxID=67373 RepID=UPI0033DB5533
MSDIERADLLEKLIGFVRDDLLNGQAGAELTSTTPLLEWGVLDSIKTARLLAFIRDDIGVRVPPKKMVGDHFKDLEHVTDLVLELQQPVG